MTLQPLITKVRAPRTPRGFLARKELPSPLAEDRLPKLVWIEAPAGYGKTSLVLDWINSKHARPVDVAWYSLDADDNDLHRFVTHLIASIQEVAPSIGADIQVLTGSSLPLDYDSVFTSLVNELERQDSRLSIVLDDVQVVESTEVHDRIEWLVHHLPDNVSIIVTSRDSPPFDIAKLRIAGDLVEVGPGDLLLSDAEAVMFFETIKPGRDPLVAVRVNKSVEGWFAAVSLAANTSVDSLYEHTGSDDVETRVFAQVFDFYAEEVISSLDRTTRELLIACSVLDSFSADLAAFISGDPKAPDLLEQIVGDNVLVNRIDGPGEWYRFHALMKEYLRRESIDPERSAELHLRAAEWFKGNGYISEAFDHALLGNDFEFAADVLVESSMDLFFGGQGSTLVRLVDRLPLEVVVSRGQICVGRAYAHVMRFEFDEARKYLDYASAAVHTGPRFGKTIENDYPIEDRRMAGLIAVAEASIATFERDLEKCIRRSLEAIDLLGTNDPEVLDIANVSLATAYWGQGKLDQAIDVFKRVSRPEADTEISLLKYMAACNAGHVLIELGRLDDAVKTLQLALEDWPAPSGQDLPFAAMAHTGLAEVALQRGDSQLAMDHAERAIDLADNWGTVEVMLTGRLIASRAAQDLDNSNISGRLVAESRNLAESRGNEWWINRVNSQAARFAVRRQESSSFLKSESIPEVNYENLFDCLTFVEELVAERSWAAAGVLVEQIERFAAEGGHRLEFANAKALRLQLVLNAGASSERELQDAVVAAASIRSWRSLIKLGSRVTSVLLKHREFVESAGASELFQLINPSSIGDQIAAEFELSDRELQVLQLICDGLSNDEIRARLVLAPSTIKTHINRLYRKIDVSTRAQAVAWAAQSGLFSS